jgi:hypothetical protein
MLSKAAIMIVEMISEVCVYDLLFLFHVGGSVNGQQICRMRRSNILESHS